MDPVAAVEKVGSIVAGPVLEAAKEWVNYVRSCDDNVKAVQVLHRDLKNRREEVVWKVELGKNQNQEAVPPITEWIKDVDELIGSKNEWKELLEDDERRKAEQCFFSFCWSPRYRHNISKKAKEKGTAITSKIEEITKRGLDPVTLDTMPVKLSSFTSSAFCRKLESREKKVKEILEVLKNDKVNRIGIHGMGGAGKTTLIQELARQAENEKLFSVVIIAEISQFPDYKRIQDQIADRIGFTTLDHYHNIDERALNLGKRLMEINRRKGLCGEGEQHGLTKRVKFEDEEGEEKKDPDKGATKEIIDKAPIKRNMSKHPSIKKSMLDRFDDKGQKKVKTDRIKEEGQIQEDRHDEDNEKEERTKGKKFNEDDTLGLPLIGQVEKSGKMLVILDNIWKKLDLHHIGISYELEKDLGCKIVVISRSEDVCKTMDALESCIFKVGDLNDEEAKYLFRDRVGAIADDEEYKDISIKLLKKCSRLPLSINLLADTLKNQTLSVWEKILKQLEKPTHGETLGVLGDTYSIIEMSYNYLGNKEMKMFFLLCCLFPPGSSVYIDDLLKYGVGMGLFQYVNSIVEAIDQAYKWVDDLKSLSLLTEVNTKKGVIYIHDDVREAGKSFAAKGKQSFHVGAIPRWLLKDSYETYTAISMISNSSYEYLGGRKLPKLQLLRSLDLSCTKLGEDYFLGMKNLKVLDMSRSEIKTLPSSFKNLENLQTLLFEYCSLEDITQISTLVKLQVLSCRESNITKLPREMEALVELKLLDLTNCKQLKEIPSGIFICLLKLEGLYMKYSFSDWTVSGSMASLSELTSLPLQVLEITIQNTSQLPDGDLPILNLSRYKIDFAMETKSIPELPDDELVEGEKVGTLKYVGGLEKKINLDRLTDNKLNDRDMSTDTLEHAPSIQDLSQLPDDELLAHDMSTHTMERAPSIEDLSQLTDDELLAHDMSTHTMERAPTKRNLSQLTDDELEVRDMSTHRMERAVTRKEISPSPNDELPPPPPPQEQLFSRDLQVEGVHARDLIKEGWKPLMNRAESLYLVKIKALKNIAPYLGEYEWRELKRIVVYGCSEMNSIISKKAVYQSVVFPKLKMLKLEHLPALEAIYQGKSPPELFSNLQELTLSYLNQLKSSAIAVQHTTKLKVLEVRSCRNLESIFFAVIATQFQGRGDTKSSYEIQFPCLKKLILANLESLQGLFDNRNKNDTKQLIFPKQVVFPVLDKIKLEKLNKIQQLWELVTGKEFAIAFPQLRSVSLNHMYKLKQVWSSEFCKTSFSFGMLKKLKIRCCDSLNYVCPPSVAIGFQELELLRIVCCEELKQVITAKGGEGELDNIIMSPKKMMISFPKLSTIEFVSLNELLHFYHGRMKVEFPALKNLKLDTLPTLKTLTTVKSQKSSKANKKKEYVNDDRILFNKKVKFPCLERLFVVSLDSIEGLWDIGIIQFSLMFPNLQSLSLRDMDVLKHVWTTELTGATRISINLKEIEIDGCNSLESLFPPSEASFNTSVVVKVVFPELQTIKVESSDRFKYILEGNLNLEFPVLKTIGLIDLSRMVAFAKVEMSETQKGGGDDPSIPLFSRKICVSFLEELQVEGLPKIEKLWDMTSSDEFSQAFASLQTLVIEYMTKLKHIWSYDPTEESLYFGSLKSIAINDCDEIESLFSGSTAGTSTSSPQYLQQQKVISFPKLQKLFLISLESFRCLFHGYSNMEFQALKVLVINRLPLVKTIVKLKEELVTEGGSDPEREEDGSSVDAVLFKGNVEFSSLEDLKIKYMPALENIFETEEENGVCSYKVFPKLKTLHLTGGYEVNYIYQLPEDMLHKLSSLVIRKFNQLKYLVSSSSGGNALLKSLLDLENLEELIVEDCESLEDIFGIVEGQDVMLYSLKKLKISNLNKLKCVQWRVLPNLQSVDISDSFEGKKFLISATEVTAGGLSSQSLESMVISNCYDMEAIIADGEKDQFQKDDPEIVFPQLKDVNIGMMASLKTFSSTNFTMHFPALVSIAFNKCGPLRSFSAAPSVIPQLNSLQVDYKTIVPHGDLDVILQREYESNNKVAKHWPQNVTSKLHEEHQLSLTQTQSRSYGCDYCGEDGGLYSYTCRNCAFDLHPHCALNESQLIEELKIGKDLPRTLNHESHAEHELKLVAGLEYDCDKCNQAGELFAYYCEECSFHLHPKCALELPSRQVQRP